MLEASRGEDTSGQSETGGSTLKAAPSPPPGGSQPLTSWMPPSLRPELTEARQEVALNWTMTLCHNYKVTAINIKGEENCPKG